MRKAQAVGRRRLPVVHLRVDDEEQRLRVEKSHEAIGFDNDRGLARGPGRAVAKRRDELRSPRQRGIRCADQKCPRSTCVQIPAGLRCRRRVIRFLDERRVGAVRGVTMRRHLDGNPAFVTACSQPLFDQLRLADPTAVAADEDQRARF